MSLVAGLVLGGSASAQPSNVVVWGRNVSILGNVPVDATNVASLSIGLRPGAKEQVVAVRSDGTVVEWGMADATLPSGLSGIAQIKVGSEFNAGLGTDGLPLLWPAEGFSQPPARATNLVDVQLGSSFAVGLRDDGVPVVWGSSLFKLTNAGPRAALLSRIATTSNGQRNVLGLRSDGEVVAWGDSAAGTNTPSFFPDGNAVSVALGQQVGAALLGDGTLKLWGDVRFGLTNPPVSATNIVAISAGSTHVLALRNDGTVVAWGDGADSKTNVPPGVSNVVGVLAGQLSSAVILGDGKPRFIDTMPRLDAARRSNIALNAFAVGAPPLTYQWFHNGAPVPDSDTPNLRLLWIDYAAAGDYSVAVSNALGSITGLVAQVTVEDRSGVSGKNVAVWPLSQIAFSPESVTNVVKVTGPAGPSPEVAYGVREDGSLVAWGSNAPSGTNAVDLAGAGFAGISHSTRNLVMAWRTNGTLVNFSSVNVGSGLDLGSITNAVGFADSLASGGYVLGILGSDGGASFWGKWSPTNAPPIQFSGLKALVGGPSQTSFLALRKDGRVVRWKLDQFPIEKAVPPHGGTNIARMAVSPNAVALLTGAGNALTSLAQRPPSGATNLVDIAAVDENVVALRNDGQVFAWGTLAAVTNIPSGLSRVISLGASSQRVLAAFGGGAVRFVDSMGPAVALPGEVFHLNAFAVGDAPLDYAWFKDGQPLAEAKAPILRLSSVVAADAGVYSVVVSNRWGMATSEVARVSAETPATLLGQPQDRIAIMGDPVSFTVQASGVPPPTYHWSREGTNIDGATNATLGFLSAQMADSGTYQVVVSNYTGVVTSRVAKLIVRPSANFNVWTFGYTNYSRTPVAPLVLTNVPVDATNIVRLVQDPQHVLAQRKDGSLVTWGSGAITNLPAGLPRFKSFKAGRVFDFGLTEDGTVVGWSGEAQSQTNIPPAAAKALDLAVGQSGKVTVIRPDGEPVTWSSQGLKEGAMFPEATGLSRVATAIDGISYEPADVGIRRDGRPVVWIGPGTFSNFESPSPATNLVAVSVSTGWAAFLDGAGGVSTSPRNLHVPRPEGVSNIVAVSAAGIHVLALRNDGRIVAWGKVLNGLTQATDLTNVPPYLTNVIAIAAGPQVNAVAVGDGTPRFVDEMGSVVARHGDDFYLNAFAVAQPPITYRWSKDGVPVPQGDAPTLKLAAVTAQTAGSYSVVVSNALGSITGVVATVTVETPASILVDPADRSVRAGYRTTFSAAAAGDPAPSVQWQFEGTNIAGANASMHSIPLIRPEDAGGYRVVVSNFTGFATSQVATLTVLPGIAFQVPNPGGGLGPDGFRFRITGLEPTGRVILYGSTNLVDWQPLRTNAPASGFLDLLDAGATNRPARFYKVEETGAE